MSTPLWDATASFSWYLYQADVALLVALERIKKIYNDSSITDKESELKKWSLEVEWEEDFTIAKKDENDDFIEKHLYQVKEYEVTTKNDWTVLSWTNVTFYLDGVVKLFQCSLNWINNTLDCKTYICGKKRIVNTSNELLNENDIINSLIKSEEKGVWYIKYKILFASTEKNKTDIKDFYNKCKKWINKLFETKIKKNNFFIWRQEWFWDFWDIHKEIQDLITEIKTWKSKWEKEYDDFYTQSDNYLRYFESKVKRMIQTNKKIKIEDRVTLNLYENILKEILTTDMHSLKPEDYQDMFFCNFIEKFDQEFIKLYELGQEEIIDNIYTDLTSDRDEYNSFLNEKRELISKNIFNYKDNIDKFLIFINYTLSKDVTLPKNIYEYTNSHYEFSRIKNKILLLITYFYAKKNCEDLKDNFFESLEKNYLINKEIYKWILTWLPNMKSDIQDFLNTQVFFQFEHSHIWIFNSDEIILEHSLSSNIPEADFFNKTFTKEQHKKYNKQINTTKAIKIFWWSNCLKWNANNYLK